MNRGTAGEGKNAICWISPKHLRNPSVMLLGGVPGDIKFTENSKLLVPKNFDFQYQYQYFDDIDIDFDIDSGF